MNNTNTATVQPLTSVASEPSTDYSDISYLEVPLQDDSWIEAVDRTGQPVVYLRVCLTGMLPRLAGPFASKEIAIWCMDALVDKAWETRDGYLEGLANEHSLRGPYQHRWNRVVPEGAILSKAPASAIGTKKALLHRKSHSKGKVA